MQRKGESSFAFKKAKHIDVAGKGPTKEQLYI
jgi:hypothetical protein